MMRWLSALILSIATLSSFAQTLSLESPTTRVNLIELYTSEG